MAEKILIKRSALGLLAAFICLVITGWQIISPEHQNLSLAPALAQSSAKSEEAKPVKASLLCDSTGIVPGGKFKLGVKFDIQPGWHTYYLEPGDSGMPPHFDWQLPAGFKAGSIIWAKPHKTVDAGLIAYAYEKSVLHACEITAPADLKEGDKLTLKVLVKYLVCKDICLPGKAELEIVLPVVKSAAKSPDAPAFDALGTGFHDPVSSLSVTPDKPDDNKTIAAGGSSPPSSSSSSSSQSTGGSEKFSVLDQKMEAPAPDLINFLWPAFLGGLILNVMPCVLPVIAIKVLSIMEQAKEEPARIKLLGLVFAAGIISSFMVLALGVILVKSAGQSVGWGFQFQYPGFVAVMCAVILLMSLSLFGMFYVPTPTSAGIDKLARKEGLSGTFFNGVLATVLSTPCTAPFLGVAMGFAFSQPAWVIAVMFLTSALGMASPYLLLTINPAWMKFLPKPGDWMDKFKQGMGFVMLFTLIWLDYVLATEVSADALGWVNAWLVGIALCAWIVANFSDLSSSQARRLKVFVTALSFFFVFSYICLFAQPGVLAALTPGSGMADAATPQTEAAVSQKEAGAYGIVWQPFSISSLNDALSQKKTVFLDFTADWCLTCKVNERTVLATQAVSEKLKSLNAVTMKADWTRQDADITKLLNKFGRSGVPLYVIFPGAHPDKPIVLPEVITQDLVVAKLDQAAK